MAKPSQNPADKQSRLPHTNLQILLFVIALCFTSAFLLAVIAFVLKTPQEDAAELDRSKQMLIATKILSYNQTFQIFQDGTLTPAQFDPSTQLLIPTEDPPKATDDEIRAISTLRIRALLTDSGGAAYTFEKKGLNLQDYLTTNKKTGYADLPLKLFYAILPNDASSATTTASDLATDLTKATSFVIPVSGYGLWGPVYGYIALESNGDTVLGTTWYEQSETPGLGANIDTSWWQQQFFGKVVFQESPSGTTDFQTAPMGILVVKGKVQDVLGTTPKANSAVDGISGATLTGDGITSAYQDSLTPYRALLTKINQETNG
ncbi:MAG: Na(+)-translocating NADH-quinone reductase subunit C [Chlamydiae bacterium]|nr:Na(+)-translocating NADH-quinone reductase subunit C [Chlamydiota bacterium]